MPSSWSSDGNVAGIGFLMCSIMIKYGARVSLHETFLFVSGEVAATAEVGCALVVWVLDVCCELATLGISIAHSGSEMRSVSHVVSYFTY